MTVGALPNADEGIVQQLVGEIRTAERSYHRLVLLVGPVGLGKTATLRRVAEQVGGRLVNLNLELSHRMLDLTAEQRVLRFGRVLDDVLGRDASTICLVRTELLFDPAFRQDPLRQLQQLSRARTVVAAWSGAVEGSFLTYAEPAHPEYRRLPLGDLKLVELSQGGRKVTGGRHLGGAPVG